MKNICILLIAIIPFFTSAQQFLDTNKTWNVLGCSTGGGTVCSTYRYKLVSDTIIDSLKYYHLYASYDSLGISWYNLNETLSEDTLSNKVYLDGTILYDFMLNKGDTIIAAPYSCFPQVVDSVDTFIYSGISRRRIFFNSSGSYPTAWISGIGSTDGFIESFIFWCMVDAEASLLCCDSAGVQLYHTLAFNTCYVTLSTNDPQRLNSVTIFPNPFHDRINIKMPYENDVDFHLKIFDISGRIVFESNVSSTEQEILLPDLANGLYTIYLKNDETYFVNKFAKTD